MGSCQGRRCKDKQLQEEVRSTENSHLGDGPEDVDEAEDEDDVHENCRQTVPPGRVLKGIISWSEFRLLTFGYGISVENGGEIPG